MDFSKLICYKTLVFSIGCVVLNDTREAELTCDDVGTTARQAESSVLMHDVSASWSYDRDKMVLHNITFEMNTVRCLCIVNASVLSHGF